MSLLSHFSHCALGVLFIIHTSLPFPIIQLNCAIVDMVMMQMCTWQQNNTFNAGSEYVIHLIDTPAPISVYVSRW